MNLNALKDKIESLPRNYHVEIGRILTRGGTPHDENKNGIFVNLSLATPEILAKVVAHIDYIELQETQINVDESSKTDLKDMFFQN